MMPHTEKLAEFLKFSVIDKKKIIISAYNKNPTKKCRDLELYEGHSKKISRIESGSLTALV